MTTIFFSEFFMFQKLFKKFPDSTSYLLSESSRFNIRCCFRTSILYLPFRKIPDSTSENAFKKF